MSSPTLPQPTPDRPPAATTGSPGTAIFFPPPHASRSLLSPRSSAARHDPPRPASPQRDRVPVQWSFESSYGLFGSTGLAPARASPKRESSGVLGGSWFGRRKERDKGKGKAKSVSVARPRSLEPQPRTSLPPAAASAPLPHVVTPPPSPKGATAPPRPERSPFRPSSALSTSNPDHLPPMDFTSSPPPHIRSAPLPSIPASNTPTPRQSRSPSPIPGPSSLPTSAVSAFRPTSAHRPGSSAGFRQPSPAPPSRSDPDHPKNRRRPATSSGVPDSNLFLAPPAPGTFISAARASSTSLAPSKVLPPRKDSRTGSAIRRRKDERERGFLIKQGKRHHPRPKEDAPYPRDYEHKALDHDVWEHSFARQLANSVTFHTFSTPPAKVLDLGCGTGTWILDCAKEWKETHFVGLDLVPIQIDLARLGQDDLASRVRWVLANFLERLPFQDEEFDFVHIKRVARGVPEDKWDPLFGEIARVLKKGGALEMIEEDLFFPGSVTATSEDDEEPQLPPTPPRTTPSPQALDKSLRRSNSDRSSTTGSSRRYSPSFLSSRSSSDTPSDPPRPANPTPTHAEAPPRMSLDSWHARSHTVAGVLKPQRDDEGLFEGLFRGGPREGLFHAQPDGVPNPRDHSVLERAYVEMHAARFINLTPLSVLNLSLSSYFRDVRSHMPIQLAFPPPPKAKGGARAPLLEIRPSNQAERASGKHYVTLDTLRAPGPRHTHNRLPNQNWRFDIQSLNMHLSLRVSEVLACAEEMWEFIEGCRGRGRERGGLAGVGREEWDDCLARFEMDMHDKIGLGPAMNDRLAWSVRQTPRTPERKAFDEAVEKWEKQAGVKTQGKGSKGRPLSRTLRAFVAWKGQ